MSLKRKYNNWFNSLIDQINPILDWGKVIPIENRKKK